MTRVQIKDLVMMTEKYGEIYFDADASYYVDRNYGSDADGNRGLGQLIVDDVTFPEPFNYYDEFGNLQEEKMENLPKSEQQNAIDIVIESI